MNALPTNAADELLDAPTPAVTDIDLKGSSVDRTKSAGTGSSAAHAAADALGIIREWGKVYTLTATSCACCGQELRDAVSVTRGIGPVCSREHYDTSFEITDEMVADALGILFASNLDTPVKMAAKALRDRPRDLCNVLIWWSSAHLDNTEVVLDCAEIMSALGFETLGERLRERNTNVIISMANDDSGDFVLRCRSHRDVRRNMGRIVAKGDASVLPREGRFKYGWQVKSTVKDLVWTILGEVYGGEWATVPGGPGKPSKVAKIVSASWRNVRSAFAAAYPRPNQRSVTPPQNVVRQGSQNRIEVHTPSRNWNFVNALKGAIHWKDRKWDARAVCWLVDAKHEARVRELVATHFNGAK